MTSTERQLRFTFVLYRKPSLSEDEFHRHWSIDHAPLVREWLARYGVVMYRQYHTPSESRKQFGRNFPIPTTDEPDGYAEFVFPDNDIGCFERATQDPYYKDVVSPDEQRFLDLAKIRMTVGWVETYVDGGKVV